MNHVNTCFLVVLGDPCERVIQCPKGLGLRLKTATPKRKYNLSRGFVLRKLLPRSQFSLGKEHRKEFKHSLPKPTAMARC